MARFYGAIGYAETVETAPYVSQEQITERFAAGFVERNTRRLQASSDKVNDDVDISNVISIIADPYSSHNFHKIRYVSFMGSKWKVTSVEVQYPRLLLTLGGVYNGPDGPESISEATPQVQ